MDRRLIALLLPALAAAACSRGEPQPVGTAELGAHIEVSADGSGASEVLVSLFKGRGETLGTRAALMPEDRLLAYADGEQQVLEQGADLLNAWYTARFDNDSVNAEFRVALERPGDTGAPSSTAALPEPFVIVAPAPGTRFEPDESITVRWDPASTTDPMRISFDTVCEDAAGNRVVRVSSRTGADTGTYTVAAAGVLGRTGDGLGRLGCRGDIRVARTKAGELDPALGAGGHILGVQERSVTFSIGDPW